MWIDAHCDVLSKLLDSPDTDFYDSASLDTTLRRLRKSRGFMQCFAIFIPRSILTPSIAHVLRSIHLFHERILAYPEMHFVKSAQDLHALQPGAKIGAMLSLEGVDALEGQPSYVALLYELGVRCIGLTWNYANWAADGVLEPRQAGLTLKGRELLTACGEAGMILDVSHLAETGFWQTLEGASSPIIASHSNSAAICNHPRNLSDEQIKALIERDGLIGLTYVPSFVDNERQASIKGLMRHIEHICALGGERHLMLGSDFDGIDEWIPGLEHPGKLNDFKMNLLKHFPDQTVEGLFWKNAFRFFQQTLP